MGRQTTKGNQKGLRGAFPAPQVTFSQPLPFSKTGKAQRCVQEGGVINFILPDLFYYTFSKIPEPKQNIYFQKYS